MRKLALLIGLSFPAAADLPSQDKGLILLDNVYYSTLYSCEHRGYEHYYYSTRPDTGNVKRQLSFFQDKRLPKHCQQKSTSTYKATGSAPEFVRGHGAPYNHFDFDNDIAHSTSVLSNIVPHNAVLNRDGLWRFTDKLIECARDNGTVEVYGGVIWGDDTSNDYFVKSHGVTTPDYLYKIIEKTNGDRNAWIMTNNSVPTADNTESYLVSVSSIEKLTGVTFNELENKNAIGNPLKLPQFCDYD